MSDKIIIGIPTFRRPEGLKLLLDSICKQNLECYDLTIIVVDNDEEKMQGFNYVNSLGSSGNGVSIKAFIEPVRGISNVRNKILTEAMSVCDGYALIMLDDDETVDENWLDNLLMTQKIYNSDVVGGAIYPKFQSPPPAWVKGLPMYYRSVKSTGIVNIIENTGNTLITLSSLRKFEFPMFDNHFGLSGGEDKEFFTRLKQQGAQFSYSKEAIANEFYPDSRVNKEWCLQRSYRVGTTDMSVYLKHVGKNKYFKELLKAIIIIIFYPLICLRFLRNEPKRFVYKLKLYRAFGKISSAIGQRYSEYRIIHGS